MHRIAYACTPLCMACLYHFAISFDKSVYSGISLLWYQCMAEWFIDHTCYIATTVGKQYIDVYLWIPFVQVTNYVRYDLTHNPCQVYIFFHHDDINKWKHFRFTGPLWGESISHRWIPVTRGQWHGALLFYLICAWTNGWENDRDVSDLRRHGAHYDVTVVTQIFPGTISPS